MQMKVDMISAQTFGLFQFAFSQNMDFFMRVNLYSFSEFYYKAQFIIQYRYIDFKDKYFTLKVLGFKACKNIPQQHQEIMYNAQCVHTDTGPFVHDREPE